jgi:hypothetical protein
MGTKVINLDEARKRLRPESGKRAYHLRPWCRSDAPFAIYDKTSCLHCLGLGCTACVEFPDSDADFEGYVDDEPTG